MYKITKTCFIALTLSLALSSVAHANSVTYDYVGNEFSDFILKEGVLPNGVLQVGNRITASATFTDPITDGNNTPSSWAISDGLHTMSYDDVNAVIIGSSLSFLDNQVQYWLLGLLSNSIDNISFTLGTRNDINYVRDVAAYGKIDSTLNAGFSNEPSTWTLRDNGVSEVPVPVALPLMASALGIFGIARRKKLV